MSVTRTRIERLERWLPTPAPTLYLGMEFLDVLLLAMQDAAIRDELLGYTDLINGPLEGREPVAATHERRVIERVHQIVNDTVARVARGELAVPPHYLFCNHRPRRVARARSTVSPHGARP